MTRRRLYTVLLLDTLRLISRGGICRCRGSRGRRVVHKPSASLLGISLDTGPTPCVSDEEAGIFINVLN